MFTISKSDCNNFKRKVFCMNTNPPEEVSKLDHALLDFSVKIKPSESAIKQHKGYAHTIAEVLKANSNYDIDRFLFAGSFGKRTNTLQSDADCVYFINNQLPPFDEILTEFYQILNQPTVKNLFNSFNIKMNRNSINFRINDLDMDVVLATNFVKDLKKGQSLSHIQQKHALDHIKVNPTENCYKYSSSLAEASVFFMKTRVSFANEMARLAKFWFKSLGGDFQNISGASTFIELIAVYAARKGRRGKRKYNPYVKAFIRMLEKIINFEKVDVAFNRCNAMFEQHPAGDSTLPRVIDPVNPYNNFAKYWGEKDIELLKSSAKTTLARMQHMITKPIEQENESDLIRTLFES